MLGCVNTVKKCPCCGTWCLACWTTHKRPVNRFSVYRPLVWCSLFLIADVALFRRQGFDVLGAKQLRHIRAFACFSVHRILIDYYRGFAAVFTIAFGRFFGNFKCFQCRRLVSETKPRAALIAFFAQNRFSKLLAKHIKYFRVELFR